MKMKTTNWTLAVAGVLLAVSARTDEGPLKSIKAQEAELEARNTAILSATTIKELIELEAIDAAYAAEIPNLTEEQKAATVARVKDNLDTRRAVEQRVAGDRAVVLREPTIPVDYDGPKASNGHGQIIIFERSGDEWQAVERWDEVVMAGASATWTVSGVFENKVPSARIEHFNAYGFPTIHVHDKLTAIVNKVNAVPTLNFTFPDCLEVGEFLLESDDGSVPEGSTASHGEHVLVNYRGGGNTFQTLRTFAADVDGTLVVTHLEEGRFNAQFELTTGDVDAPAKTVSITGELNDVVDPCAGESDS